MRFVLLLSLGFVLGSCVVPERGSEPGRASETPAGKGVLVVHLKTDRTDRALLGSAWASERADAYELLLIGPEGNRAVDLSSGTGQIVAVTPGTWRVLVLAGIKRSSGSSTVLLVGSALAENVAVVAGQRTNVNAVLKSIDLSLETTGAAHWKGGLTLRTAGKTRNSRLGMLLAGASTTARPRLKSVELWNGYREMASVTGTPDDWAAEATGIVPDKSSSLTVALIGAGLCVQDSGGVWIPTAGLTSLTWTWPTRADLSDTHPLVPLIELSVPAGPPPTGLDIDVTWE